MWPLVTGLFHLRSVFKVHLRFCMGQYFISFYDRIIFHCVNAPHSPVDRDVGCSHFLTYE